MALSANALTTVATVEDELSIATGTETARLQRFINIASETAESYARRVFYRDTAITEKVTGGAGPMLVLDHAPINSITSITYLGTTIAASSYEIHDANAGLVYGIGGSWSTANVAFSDISGTSFTGVDRRVYTVVYDGGWYTAAQATGEITRNLPWDIEYAVIAMVSHMRRSMGRDSSITSESLLGSSISYAGSGTGGSVEDWLRRQVPAAAGILNRYKRFSLY